MDTLDKVAVVIDTIQTHFSQERWARDRISYFQREASRLAAIGDPRLRAQRAVEVDRAADTALATLEGLLTPTEPGGVVDLRGAGEGAGVVPRQDKSILFGLGARDLVVLGGVVATAGAAAWMVWGDKLTGKAPPAAGQADGTRMTKVALFGGGAAPPNRFLPENNPYYRGVRRPAEDAGRAGAVADPDDDEPYS